MKIRSLLFVFILISFATVPMIFFLGRQLHSIDSNKLFDLVNEWRTKNGYTPFIKSDILCSMASARVPEIKQNPTHEGAFKYWKALTYKKAAENLAESYDTEEDVVNGWVNSPTHFKNLRDDYQYSCIESDGDNIVQEFATF